MGWMGGTFVGSQPVVCVDCASSRTRGTCCRIRYTPDQHRYPTRFALGWGRSSLFPILGVAGSRSDSDGSKRARCGVPSWSRKDGIKPSYVESRFPAIQSIAFSR